MKGKFEYPVIINSFNIFKVVLERAPRKKGNDILRIPLASSGLRDIDIEAAVKVLKSGMLTMGAQVRAFETAMAAYLGVDHFVMVNSGSSANLAIFEALMRPAKGSPHLRPGDGVLVPAIAWPTTVWPIIQLGLEPVFVDVDPETLAIDLSAAEKAIQDAGHTRVRAIFPIHPLGFSLDNGRLTEFSDAHNLILINDMCEALGSRDNGEHAGTSGLASSFSFYFSHHLTTMEGGGVATNDQAIADDLRSIRSHGWSRDRSDMTEWTSGVSATDAKFLFVTTGYNIRPMEIQAAIGLQQLIDIDGFVERRREIGTAVYRGLSSSTMRVIDAGVVTSTDPGRHSWMLIPIQIIGSDAKNRKNLVTQKLEEFGVETRPVLTGNFLSQPSVRRIFGHLPHPEAFPNASFIAETTFLVGAHHDFSDAQVQYLIECLNSVSK
jgi:CDP-6-deoxy-D-xylo-4-hexulose-3-dehydrase